MERSLLLFRESVKSKETYHTYLTRVKLFMKYHGIQSYDDIIRQPNLQELFEDWIISKKQEVNPNGLATYYYGVKNFFDANEIELNYKKIKKFFPQKIKKSGRKPYTNTLNFNKIQVYYKIHYLHMESKEFKPLFDRVLKYYEKKLRDVACESNISELIQQDLIDNADELDELKEVLEKYPKPDLSNWAKSTLCNAIDAYINYLENTVKETIKKVEHPKLFLKNTNEEIDLATKARKEFCSNEES